jgi:hypothetical protein
MLGVEILLLRKSAIRFVKGTVSIEFWLTPDLDSKKRADRPKCLDTFGR